MPRKSQIFRRQARIENIVPVEGADTLANSAQAKTLLNALLGEKIRFVLIKGEPGAGKTTLALELMKNFGGGMYVSTRVSKQLTLAQQPAIGELIKKGKITELSLDNDEKRGISFEDYRLSTHEDIIQGIIQGFESNSNTTEPLIVLDSWDAIAKRVDSVERQKIEQALLVMAEAKGARILFVSEEPALTTIDYVVDAVVSLSDEVLNGRRLRRIAWKKLRGSAIPQRSFLYTLCGGRFTVFENTRILRPGNYPVKPFAPIKHSDQFYSTGSRDLDHFFGEGLAKGTLIVLELGEHVNPLWHIPIVQSMQSNFLANEGCVFVVPTIHSTPMFAKAKLAQYFPQDVLASSLRVGHFETYPSDPCFVKLEASETIGKTGKIAESIRAMRGDGGKSCLYVLGVDTLEAFLSEDALRPLSSKLSQSMKVSGDLMICVVKPGSKIGATLVNSCDIHMRFEEVDRTLVLYSLNPASELLHVHYDYGAGYPHVRLIPIQ
jgi:KaiC/GvpD/RAD55 family RecA-like ATPase